MDTIVLHSPGDAARARWLTQNLPGRASILCEVGGKARALTLGRHLLRVGVAERAAASREEADALVAAISDPGAASILLYWPDAAALADQVRDAGGVLAAMSGDDPSDAAATAAFAADLNGRDARAVRASVVRFAAHVGLYAAAPQPRALEMAAAAPATSRLAESAPAVEAPPPAPPALVETPVLEALAEAPITTMPFTRAAPAPPRDFRGARRLGYAVGAAAGAAVAACLLGLLWALTS